jgi:hypothetical protein
VRSRLGVKREGDKRGLKGSGIGAGKGSGALDAILTTMHRKLGALTALCAVSFLPAAAQAPSTSTLSLSLKTISKALPGCRETYTRTSSGAKEPMLMSIVGQDNYEKDITSLGHAETFVNALIAKPDITSGKILVAILSTSDDFSIGVGSTRAEVLRHMVIDRSTTERQTELMLESKALNDCQKTLFNAGDDFVDLVMNFVGAEDNALSSRSQGR